jgi:hypothetical protein
MRLTALASFARSKSGSAVFAAQFPCGGCDWPMAYDLHVVRSVHGSDA